MRRLTGWGRRLGIAAAVAAVMSTGCGKPQKRVELDLPATMPAEWSGRTLFHTPHAFIYAADAAAADEADAWVADVGRYADKTHHRPLEKGLVIVVGPRDEPVVSSLEDQLVLERDRTMIPTPPRQEHSLAEIRAKLAEGGIPEGPMVRGATVPLSPRKLRSLGLNVDLPWAVAAPSHDMALEVGMEVIISAMRKKEPTLDEARARNALGFVKNLMAKPFEVPRSTGVFILFAQRQADWTDEQRRTAIREQVRHAFKANGLPPPEDQDLDW